MGRLWTRRWGTWHFYFMPGPVRYVLALGPWSIYWDRR